MPDDQWVEQTIEDEENLLCDDRTPMMLLMQVFSDVEYEELLKTFEQENYNLENTIVVLLNRKETRQQQQQQQQQQQPPPSRVRPQICRYFLEGNCFRKDCWYSHDLDNRICKFW